MKKNKKNALIVILLLLLTVTAGFAVYTYAKYTSSLSDKNGSATIAKWDFVNDNNGTALTSLTETYNASTLVSGKIAPGTEGQFRVALVNTHSEVGVSYSVNVGTVTGAPSGLKFYSDSARTTELTSSGITGTLAPQDSTGTTVTIYWKWVYSTDAEGDAEDTTAGASPSTLSIPVQITGTQVQPTLAS